VVAAATLSTSRYDVSSSVPVPPAVRNILAQREIPVVVESDEEWLVRARSGRIAASRVRLIGSDPVLGAREAASALADAINGSPDIAVYSNAVTQAGRIEVLPFLREQAISITAHRFGNPSTLSEGVI
jgi:RHH-type proline utilization regulon transcriptional repressor/proline dehydrogenase/delta 1-pyrroline-5-carboxylate dehydrogenase